MKKIILFFTVLSIFVGCSLNLKRTTNINQEYEIENIIAELPTYIGGSLALREMVQIVQDSANNRYSCEDLNRLTFTTINMDSNNIVHRVGPDFFHYNDLFINSSVSDSNEMVVIKIGSTDVFTKRNLLIISNPLLGLKYVGDEEYELKFDQFEDCLIKQGVTFSIDFQCDSNCNIISVYNYGEYKR